MVIYEVEDMSSGWSRAACLALVSQPATPAWEVTGASVAIGGCGGIAIFFQVTGAPAGAGWYSPYFSQGDNGDAEAHIDANPEGWLDGMAGASDWSEWDGPYVAIPLIY